MAILINVVQIKIKIPLHKQLSVPFSFLKLFADVRAAVPRTPWRPLVAPTGRQKMCTGLVRIAREMSVHEWDDFLSMSEALLAIPSPTPADAGARVGDVAVLREVPQSVAAESEAFAPHLRLSPRTACAISNEYRRAKRHRSTQHVCLSIPCARGMVKGVYVTCRVPHDLHHDRFARRCWVSRSAAFQVVDVRCEARRHGLRTESGRLALMAAPGRSPSARRFGAAWKGSASSPSSRSSSESSNFSAATR